MYDEDSASRMADLIFRKINPAGPCEWLLKIILRSFLFIIGNYHTHRFVSNRKKNDC